jgi:predicted metal-dependent hydrolase
VPPTSDEPLSPDLALAEAQRLLDAGQPFHAHEVLEAVWKTAPDDERDLWQGLAQLAVGLTHARRGNARGAAALLRRGASRLERYRGHGPHSIDIAALQAHASELAGLVESAGLAALDPAELSIQLAAPGSGSPVSRT